MDPEGREYSVQPPTTAPFTSSYMAKRTTRTVLTDHSGISGVNKQLGGFFFSETKTNTEIKLLVQEAHPPGEALGPTVHTTQPQSPA